MSVSPSASHLAISASTSALAATLMHWSELRVAPLIFFSSSSSICRSRFFRFLSFFSTSAVLPSSLGGSVAGAAAGAAAGVASPLAIASTASSAGALSWHACASPSSAAAVCSACCSAFRRAARFSFFSAVLLLVGLGTATIESSPTTPTCGSLFHRSYFSCSSGGTYPFFTRTAGRSVPSGRLDCGNVSYDSVSAAVSLSIACCGASG
mmetsp:Transcript_52950/g.121561  ORF Transcript_52950/g.121561 Transcript_52950/m.121561 type:complete len:209 (-) Transcript_52950:198-824(-)